MPDEVPQDEAELLVRIGRAVPADPVNKDDSKKSGKGRKKSKPAEGDEGPDEVNPEGGEGFDETNPEDGEGSDETNSEDDAST